ncbi:hypothetical protein IMSHALPRED_001970 [Imshaugia aleurites]|uniref:Uncharacterized protein n=1 Tax=Imshaugia aleurites TaxID=172621 RepID=A0A8H3EW86_9LECA|nr:hypothetical protein IMSHALPRED_001970 [Imshaugia aleurites]
MSRRPRRSSVLTPQGLEGCILFLKKPGDIDDDHLERYDLETTVFWHPVLVLQNHNTSNETTVCILNTLNDCNAEDRFDSSSCHFYLAIWPKHPPLSGQPQLNLQGNVTLRRPGYINIRREYLVHQDMLQPYDWDEPTNYYRLTQKSFAVVVAKLDTIYYSSRLAKLDAKNLARKVATSRATESVVNAARLNEDIVRLMAVKKALPPGQSESDRQPRKAETQASFAAVSSKATRVRSGTPASFSEITRLVILFLLGAAMGAAMEAAIIWATRIAGPAWRAWLIRRSSEMIMQVWRTVPVMSWKVGEMIVIGLKMLEKTVAAWGRWFAASFWSVMVPTFMDDWTTLD